MAESGIKQSGGRRRGVAEGARVGRCAAEREMGRGEASRKERGQKREKRVDQAERRWSSGAALRRREKWAGRELREGERKWAEERENCQERTCFLEKKRRKGGEERENG
ncbi:hypothetical protein BT93_C1956 [Corymbia citriodora subsp. variegata]|nr:hypothetical protein BT93_C1956 [Corymbia citriodora subsp. variegata]